MITSKQVELAIADICGGGWRQNGHRVEGWSIIAAEPGESFRISSVMAERLRLRLNSIDLLVNGRDEHKPFKYWTLKSYPMGTELRFIFERENDYNQATPSPISRDYEVSIQDGYLSLAGWLMMLRYGGTTLDVSPDDSEHYGSEAKMIGYLVDDWSTDHKSLYKDGQDLYDHIARVGCTEAVDALNAVVDAYRKYCEKNGLVADAIDKWGNREEEEDDL